jgi:hypothetical protein
MTTRTLHHLTRRLAAGLAAALLVLGLLHGCGGGVGTGGTGDGHAFVSGSITGFGSVIVNDVRFDDSGAQVEDGDDGRRERDELRLGMTVEIDSSAIQGGFGSASAAATRIRFDSALVGRVQSVDEAAGSFTVLGQRVTVDETTVFDGGLRPATMRAGDLVEVYAVLDSAQQRYRATRVEPARSVLAYRVRGPVAQFDPVLQRLRIGSEFYSTAGAANLPPNLAPGQFVRLTLRLVPDALGRFVVLSFGTPLRGIGDLDDVRVKGLVSAFGSVATFEVDGRPVDASAARFVDGSPALGVRVEVEGAVRGGVLRARTVTVRSDQFERDRGFELRGPVESVDTGQRTFVLRGLTIGTARPDLRYENGSFADLAAGRRVEVRAQFSLLTFSFEATRIEFE